MKQILQSLKNGRTTINDLPIPNIKSHQVLIATQQSLISPGTEKMLVAFGEASLLEKARQQPDKVKMVIDKIKTDGLFGTFEAVRHKLDQLIPMGYSNVGRVVAVGDDVHDFVLGDRVVSNGAHAELVAVSKNLCCKIPDQVTNDDAAFTVLGAIALQGMRLAEPLLGETFAVVGLGLIGLLTVQLLQASGVRVLGIDLSADKCQLAQRFGAETVCLTQDGANINARALQLSRGFGVDGVILTCATQSNQPMTLATQICRKRGRIILVGSTGLQLSRALFYEKELRFQVSCAYGPGRYDPNYEQGGQDYPQAFVRFTAQRNFQAFLDIIAQGRCHLAPLITHRYPLDQAEAAYQSLLDQKETATQTIGIMLDYPQTADIHQNTVTLPRTNKQNAQASSVHIGFIGSGQYGSRILIPAFKKTSATACMIACETGINAIQTAKRLHIGEITTDAHTLINHPDINTVVIATRHESHAALIQAALAAHKHVFVEKPLCLNLTELSQIENAISASSTLLMVGFNRRFSPFIQKIKKDLLNSQESASFIMTVNAGMVPAHHWIQDKHVGGGRIIGEVCHFIDLLRYLAGHTITQYQITALDGVPIRSDKISISLSFANGSFGIIHYLAHGHPAYPKERLEIFQGGRILQLDNFRVLRGFGFPHFKKWRLWRQDKGHETSAAAFVSAIEKGKPSPVPLNDILEVARVTIEIAQEVG